MNEARVNSIKKVFEGLGLEPSALYTNQEIVDKLQELNRTMKEGVYEKVHAEYMRDKDLLIHFTTLATEYGLQETETFKRFERNMKDLGFTIATYIKGLQGEKAARKNLKALAYDRDVKVLYNIALEDEDAQSEFDAIVITPYGLFTIEVKNWNGEMHFGEDGFLRKMNPEAKYDLLGRMGIKEGLLREYLGELFPQVYKGMVLFPNESAKVVDEYGQMPIICGGGIVYKIRSFDEGKEVLTAKQIEEVAKRIFDNHKEQKTLCKVNCTEIIEDYAVLMAAIEDAAEGTFSSIEELKDRVEESVREEVQGVMETTVNEQDTLQNTELITAHRSGLVAGSLAGMLLTGLSYALVQSIVKRK